MGRNKVVLFGATVMDISDSNISEEALVEGASAYGADGEKIDGTNPYKKAETDSTVNVQGNLIEQIAAVLQHKTGGGGSGGASITTGNFAVSESMYEPGVNEYILTSNELKADSRTLILVVCTIPSGYESIPIIFFRNNTSGEFTRYDGDMEIFITTHTAGHNRVENDSTIMLYGGPNSDRTIDTMYFIAV